MLKLTGTLVLVGAGKMGGAMLEGWLKSGADPTRIVAAVKFKSGSPFYNSAGLSWLSL